MDEAGYLVDVVDIPYGISTPASNVTSTLCLGFGDESKLGDCRIKTRPNADCQDQKGATMVGPVAEMAYVCRSCGCNAHNAMCNRHGSKAPPFENSFDWFISRFETWEAELASMYYEHLSAHEEEWQQRWSASKWEAIQTSVANDDVAPWKVKCMVKRETGHKKPSKARCIQFYPNLATQELYARETASLQKAWTTLFYRHQVDPDNPGMRVTFSSGMNAAKLGDWATEALKDYEDPYFYERDGKNWDATMAKPHSELKFRVYRMAGHGYTKYAQDSAKVSGFGKFKEQILRYSLDYTTKSGHNDTTLGNNIVNCAITCSTFRGRKCDILIAGDDLLVIVEGEVDKDLIVAAEASFGIVPEARVFRSIEDSSYISGLFAITPEGVKFLARPGRMLSCLFWSVKPPSMNPVKLRMFQRGIAKGVLPTMACVPIVGEWLKMIGDDGPMIADRSRRVYTYGAEIVADFRPWFDRRYGLSQHDIDEAIAILLENGPRCNFVNCHAIQVIKEVDFADLDDRECNGDY